MFRKSTLFGFISLYLLVLTLQAQVGPEKKKIKVQMFVNGKLHPINQTFTKADKDIQLRAYDAQTNKELAITIIDASLIRNGQKIVSVSLPGSGSIEKLIVKAHNNDNYIFEIKQLLEMADDLSLKPFSDRTFKVSYAFFDADLDAGKITVGAN
ncbi:hypothetical protein [Emticicia sp. SJ17W-69]|uniref:hypothetical protein n=1 Tax=Emticicia sp. SJ17W-69 TaxID=3421657 RepID=UPI003EBB3A69